MSKDLVDTDEEGENKKSTSKNDGVIHVIDGCNYTDDAVRRVVNNLAQADGWLDGYNIQIEFNRLQMEADKCENAWMKHLFICP